MRFDMLRYLSRYTHRVAISNRRLVAAGSEAIAFRWKDYRLNGAHRWKTMHLHPHEFIRRFLLHVLPKGFHRIRHYGLFASTNRAQSIATARALLNVPPPDADPQEQPDVAPHTPRVLPYPCPCCGARMIVIETFAPGCQPSWRPTLISLDTSLARPPISVAAFQFQCAGSTPAVPSLHPIASISARIAHRCAPNARPNA